MFPLLRLAAVVLATTVATPALAQTPVLLVRPDRAQKQVPLTIARADTRVVIRGTLAETTTTLTFRNDNARVLEGELLFPLPEGSTVSGYALDLDGELVDAVVVPKEEARIVFEKEVRKNVDPGLVEWTKGNNFRTRVYPIPARGTRSIRVSFVSELGVTEGKEGALVGQYHLPLRYPQPIPAFDVSIDYAGREGATAQPELTGGGRPFGGLRFTRNGDRFTLRFSGEGVALTEDLRVVIPNLARQGVALERDGRENVTFFINDMPSIRRADRPRTMPKRIALYWDGSLSHGMASPEVRRAELALLRKALEPLDGVAVDLFVFRDRVEAPRGFTVVKGQSPGLFQALEQVAYDGGTSLGLSLPGSGASDYGYALLVTDGLGNLGDALPRSSVPVYTISADASADHAVLRHVAQLSGGQYLNLQRLTVEQAAGRIGVPVFSLVRVEVDPKQVSELYPSGVQAVNGSARIAGRMLTPEATLTLHYGYSAAETPVFSVQYILSKSSAVPATGSAGGAGLVTRAWAQKKVDELALLPEKNHEALVSLGRNYNLVTPGTSLLVLETLEQHLTHKIAPAPSRKEMHAQYLAQVTKQEQEKKRSREEKLQQVAQMWQARVAWWERTFDKPRKRPSPKKGSPSAEGAVSDGAMGAERDAESEEFLELAESAPAGAAAPPPPASPGARAGGGTGMGMGMGSASGRGMAEKKTMSAGNDEPEAPPAPSIAIKPWDPQTPYLAAIKAALKDANGTEAPRRAYAAYLAQRPAHQTSPAFYLDCAELLFRQGRASEGQRAAEPWHGLGVRVLSSIVDLGIEDPRLVRVVGHKLRQEGALDLAVDQFEKALKLRPEEPQSYRDLALALAERARSRAKGATEATAARAVWRDAERAVALLNDVAVKPWDGRFPDIEVVALEEANEIVAWTQRLAGKPGFAGLELRNPLDGRLRKLLDYDVRIVMTWDTDNSDMDLWVTEPTGEKCYYGHNLTEIGGAITRDFTQGYGPEAYAIRRAIPGKYVIQTNYYGTREQTLTGPTTLQAEVITRFGRPDESRRSLTLRLGQQSEVVDVGAIDFK